MNSHNSLLVPIVLLFLLFLIILPCNSVSSNSRKKSGSRPDVEKYMQRREPGESDRTSRRSSGHRTKSGQRRKSDRRRKHEEEEDGDQAGDKYKYNRNGDEGPSRRDGGHRPSGNREPSRGRPTERGRKSHGKPVEYENYERRSRRISRSKSRGEGKSRGGSERHGHQRRSRHERDNRHDDGKRSGRNAEEVRHRHSSSNRERRRGSISSRRGQSQTRREGKSVSKSDAHKSKAKDYDEKTVPFLNRYAQQQSEKDNKNNQQRSRNKSVGASSEQPKNAERQNSTGSKRRSGKDEKSNKGQSRSSSAGRQKSSGSGGGNREGRPVSGGGGRVEIGMGRPVAIGGVEAGRDAKPKQSELEKDAAGNPQPRAPNSIIWAVARGFNMGIYKSWAECLKNIDNYPNALFRTFDSEKEAKKFIKNPEEFDGLTLAGGSRTGQPAYFHESGVAAVYTDGSTKGGVTSIGVFWGDGDPRNTGEIIEDADADTGEYWAIIRALEIGSDLDGLAIRTDFKSALDVIKNNLDNLEDGNDEWRNRHGKRIKNIGLFRRIKALRQQFRDRHAPVYFEKVDAHSGDYGNNQADRLARKARNVVSHYVVPNYGIFTVHRHSLSTGMPYARRFYDRLPDAIQCYNNLSN